MRSKRKKRSAPIATLRFLPLQSERKNPGARSEERCSKIRLKLKERSMISNTLKGNSSNLKMTRYTMVLKKLTECSDNLTCKAELRISLTCFKIISSHLIMNNACKCINVSLVQFLWMSEREERWQGLLSFNSETRRTHAIQIEECKIW